MGSLTLLRRSATSPWLGGRFLLLSRLALILPDILNNPPELLRINGCDPSESFILVKLSPISAEYFSTA